MAKLSSEKCLRAIELYQSLGNEIKSDLKLVHWINQLLPSCIHWPCSFRDCN